MNWQSNTPTLLTSEQPQSWDYVEHNLLITQGDHVGDYVSLMPWQRQFLDKAFAPDIQTAALSIARGNGKTTFLAKIASASVNGPLAQPRAEVIICASSFAQAKILFNEAVASLRPCIDECPKDWRLNDTPQKAELKYLPTGVTLKAIGSDAARMHGLQPSLLLLDEPSQWPRNTRDAMLAALVTSLGKIPGAKAIALGTKSNDESHFFNRWL